MQFEGELAYPQLTDPLVFNAFAAATHPTKPSSPFLGRLATISFSQRPLTAAQIGTLYRRGADFCIVVLNQIDRSGKFLNFVSNSISSLLGAISSAAATVTQTSTGDDDEDGAAATSSSPSGASASESKKQQEAHRDIFKHLLCLFHPKCVENHLALDCSPHPASSAHTPSHASILPGVQIVTYRDIRDGIHLAIGGITCFFPLFQHLDVISPGAAAGSAAAKAASHRTSASGGAATDIASPTRMRSPSSILPLLLRTLQLMLRDSAANQISFLQSSGFQVVSHLLMRYTGVHHLTESMLVPIEEMIRDFSWGVGLAKLLASQPFDDVADVVSGGVARQQQSHTNHNLPVARAAERSLYNDFFLGFLLNFGLWYRVTAPTAAAAGSQTDAANAAAAATPSTASAALDDLSQQQVPFGVQLEVLMVIKSHILRNPRYFRRLLSAGGGSGAQPPNAHQQGTSVHAAGGSIGPTKFVLDSLRRFLNYQPALEQYAVVSTTLAPPPSAASIHTAEGRKNARDGHFFHPYLRLEVATAIRNLRTLRREWLTILQGMMLCSVGPASTDAVASPGAAPSVPVVRDADIATLLQLICEASEASAAAAASEVASAASAAAPSFTVATNAQSWILVEYIEFLTSILRLRPDDLHPILQRHGGGMLFMSVLQRNVRYQHVQVAVIHLVAVMLYTSYHERTPADQHGQVTMMIAALQTALAETYLTVPAYEALIELACGLGAGALGTHDAADESIERFCAQMGQAADSHSGDGEDYRDEAFSPAGSPLSRASASPSARSGASSPNPTRDGVLARATICFPRALEAVHALLRNNAALRVRERHLMHEQWSGEVMRRATSRAMGGDDEWRTKDDETSESTQSPPPAPTHMHRSSDNIHFDEEVAPASSSPISIHPPLPPFSQFHPTHNPLVGSHFDLLTSPVAPMTRFLADLAALVATAPNNCQVMLTKWPLGIKLCMAELDWLGPSPQMTVPTEDARAPAQQLEVAPTTAEPSESVSSPLPSFAHDLSLSDSEEERLISEKLQQQRPSLILMDIDSLLQAPSTRHHASIDEEIANLAPSLARTAAAITTTVLTAPSSDPYLQAVFRQQLLADIDLEAPSTPDSESIDATAVAARVIESLLMHALAQIKDGWTYWRDALLMLRLEAEDQQDQQDQQAADNHSRATRAASERIVVTEERFRAVRRHLLVGLFARLHQLPSVSSTMPPSPAVGAARVTLHANLSHVIDLLEEVLYFDQRFKQIKFRMVDAGESDREEASSPDATNLVRKRSRLDSLARTPSLNGAAGGDAWVLMDEEDDLGPDSTAASFDPLSSATSTAAASALRQEWPMIRALLLGISHLRFSMQPMRFTATHSSASLSGLADGADSSASSDLAAADGSSSSSASSASRLRTGGPLRVVIRLLLDCCSSVTSSTLPPADPTQLPEMVSQLGALVHVELAIDTVVSPTGQRNSERGASREWKNRYVLHILWRLCQMIHTLPADAADASRPSAAGQMRRTLLSTVHQIIESLKPFAVVHTAYFDTLSPPTTPTTPTTPNSDRLIYMPLEVNQEGFMDMQLADDLSSDSPLYPRLMRCCNEYIAASVQLFRSMEVKFQDEYLPEAEKQQRAMRRRLKEHASDSTTLGRQELARTSWRSVQTFSYAEVNRRAVTDTLYAEHTTRIADQWRHLAHQLYADGSAWCATESATRRKLYKIDSVEDGYRMRRKIKVFLDAPDHHQASQA